MLYIPHGSDNTQQHQHFPLAHSSFISHMVQIILRGILSSGICIELYIPHGSDNTHMVEKLLLRKMDLYIPHGSDNTTASLA